MASTPQKALDEYNYSMLPSGELYKIGFGDDRLYWIYTIPFIGLTVSFIIQNSPSRQQIAQRLWGIGIVFILAGSIVLTLWGYIRRWLYHKAVKSFALKNNLQTLSEADMSATIPPCAAAPEGAYNLKLNGYLFMIGNTPVAIFDYSYTVGSGRSSKDYQFALATHRFDKTYPHLFLDSKANGRNYLYAGSQKVDLEGDFDKYFQLYIPKGSQADALTIFSPDVMQSLINTAKPFDIEIDGNIAAIVTRGYAFTRDNVSNFLIAAGVLSKEFIHLDKSWRLDTDNKGKAFVLQRHKYEAIIVFCLFVFFYLVLYFGLNHFAGR